MADIAWPIATIIVAAIAGRCVFLLLKIRGDAAARAEERHEQASGVLSVVEAARKEMHDAKVRMDTFIANSRGRNG